MIAGGVLLGLALIAALFASPVLDVDDIDVAGSTHTDVALVRDAAGVDGDGLLMLDTGAAERRVEALPWVADATVVRAWPGTVKITVTERVAVARIALGPQVALVDETGRVLGVVAPETPDLPRVELTAVGEVPVPGATIEQTTAAIVAAGLTGPLAERAQVVQGDPLVVVLDNSTEVRLGDASDVVAKIAAADAVLRQRGDAGFTYIDVRVPSAPAVGN
jgi:cell division protein FtsQ